MSSNDKREDDKVDTDDAANRTDRNVEADSDAPTEDAEAPLILTSEDRPGDDHEGEDDDTSDDDVDVRPENEPAPEKEAQHSEAEQKPTQPATPSASTTQPATSKPRSGGFVPALIGGVVAGAIGFGIAAYLGVNLSPPEDSSDSAALEQAIETQGAKLDEVSQRLAQLADTPPPAENPAGQEIVSQIENLAAAISATNDGITALGDRMNTLEQQPAAAPDTSAETSELQARIAELESRLADADARNQELEAAIQDARATADSTASSAEEAQAAAERRVALAHLVSAIDRGATYNQELVAFPADTQIPETLQQHAGSGIPTLSALRESFPDAARDALEQSIRTTVSEDPVERIGAFLRNQTGARSLKPREGNDPDAVLSRAEAALNEARLPDTLAELQNLPEAGQQAMSDWVAQAQLRIDAMNALSSLNQQM
ncbi:COG4223 family protein [Qingshengfaniella alkalisoli]|uniref:Mitochondrial inner membrane protein n=1 Tax=Qingshengfaniella alkalisoli TaxID=2599296 RepID=A0A5B8I4X0_9RHOB|nr:hypothetical protein [Qingshengfaniella alkalisoli]QDY68249.1 hypothetical protein FPZ52_00515 [Qingshengfaniella alkalisoli]